MNRSPGSETIPMLEGTQLEKACLEVKKAQRRRHDATFPLSRVFHLLSVSRTPAQSNSGYACLRTDRRGHVTTISPVYPTFEQAERRWFQLIRRAQYRGAV